MNRTSSWIKTCDGYGILLCLEVGVMSEFGRLGLVIMYDTTLNNQSICPSNDVIYLWNRLCCGCHEHGLMHPIQ